MVESLAQESNNCGLDECDFTTTSKYSTNQLVDSLKLEAIITRAEANAESLKEWQELRIALELYAPHVVEVTSQLRMSTIGENCSKLFLPHLTTVFLQLTMISVSRRI